MKKFINLAFIVLLVIFITSCIAFISEDDTSEEKICTGTGICVKHTGGCIENVACDECFDGNFYKDKTCDEVDPEGACVAFMGGCDNNVRNSLCTWDGGTFYEGQVCDAVDPYGACVNIVDDCKDNIRESECSSLDTFHEGETCPVSKK